MNIENKSIDTDIKTVLNDNEKLSDHSKEMSAGQTPSNNAINIMDICQINKSESCMTVPGRIGKVKIRFLIDTGASCTIVSEKHFENIEKSEGKRRMEVKGQQLIAANGSPLRVLGKMFVPIQIGKTIVEHEIIGAGISDQGILGFDFLNQHKCVVSASEKEMYINNVTIPCRSIKNLSIRRIQLKESCVIPASSEALVEVAVTGSNLENNDTCVLMEPLQKFESKYKLKVAPNLCDLTKEQLIVRILNPNTEDVQLYGGTSVALVDSSITDVYFIDFEGDDSPVNQNMSVRHIGDRISMDLLGPNKEHVNPNEVLLGCNSVESQNQVPEHIHKLYEHSIQGMSEKESADVAAMLVKFQEVFQKNSNDLGRMNPKFGEYTMQLTDTKPIRLPPRRTPTAFREVEEQEVQRMLDLGVIRPSISPWASAVVLVKKKDGSTRFCIDYRSLNKVVVKDCYPLPRVDDCLDSLSCSNYFSCMDLASGYWQLPVHEDDKPKTAFVTKSGLYEFNVLPFGLTNAASTFERCMESVLRGCQWKTCLIYLDDVIVFSRSFTEHIQRLSEVLEKLQDAGLKLKPSKCHFFQKSVVFLGHLVSNHGVTTDPAKIEVLQQWPVPKNIRDVRSFLGFCSYYRRYVPHFYEVSSPLSNLTKSESRKSFKWTSECQESFDKLIDNLSTACTLAYPRDEGLFILDTDASEIGIGATLSQLQGTDKENDFPKKQQTSLEKKFGGEEKVISFGSRSLSKEERNYCVTRKELLAIVYFMNYYRHYLLGRKFLVRSDHHALQWIFKLKDPSGQMARWQEQLANFDFEILYRPGRQHSNADGLSRIPWDQIGDPITPPCNLCKKCEKQENCTTLIAAIQTRSARHDQNGNESQSGPRDQNWICGYTPQELKQLQEKDPIISVILNHKDVSAERPTASQMARSNPAVRNLWLLWDSLERLDGVLYRVDGRSKRLVLPISLKKEVIYSLHNSLLSGHLGVKKVYRKALTQFYWYQMREDIQTYIASCSMCGRNKKTSKKPRAPLSHLPVGAPMDRISTDLFGPLPITPRQNKYVLLLTDLYSKWVELLPIPDATAETCARVILNEFIARFGCPLSIHSDQGRNYESDLFQELCQLLEIKKTRTSPRHPSGNGQVECFNKTLITLIRAYLKGKQSNWDLYLGSLAGAYRATPHESTGFTPNCVMFGRENRMPADLLFGSPVAKETTYGDHINRVKQNICTTYALVSKHLQKAAIRQEENYNLRVAFHPYKIGDLVYYRNEGRRLGRNPKLQYPYEGPGVVMEKKNDLNYVVQMPGVSKLLHYDKLKPYLGIEPRWAKALKRTLPN